MCGIVGYTGEQKAQPILLNALSRLEYRGYDSAGIAVQGAGSIHLRKVKGKIEDLRDALQRRFLEGTAGIGHTRWATHGVPSDENAHPHFSEDRAFMLVHNGIIENHERIRSDLISRPTFTSQTDTEVLVHLLSEQYRGDLTEALRRCLQRVEGSYSVVAMTRHEPGVLVAARSGSPLILGKGRGEMYAASDLPALLPHTRRVVFLEEGEIATLRPDRYTVQSLSGEKRTPRPTRVKWDAIQAEKKGYSHFMLKEISEQPEALEGALNGRIEAGDRVRFPDGELDEERIQSIRRVILVACGTSYHACLAARYWFDEFTDLPVEVEIASEFRYRSHHPDSKTLLVGVSQSGETADTLAALRRARSLGLMTLTICNVLGSTMTRVADHVLYTHAGPEISVASTKAFTTQLAVLLLLAVRIGQIRGTSSGQSALLGDMVRISDRMHWMLEGRGQYAEVIGSLQRPDSVLYIGRHFDYPLALEGAIKMKEISYIHAEGYPAGELKHGPIALISPSVPLVALNTDRRIEEKTLNNVQEVRAREGRIVGIGRNDDSEFSKICDFLLPIPPCHDLLTPFFAAVAIQLLAYEAALERGCDIDQPRNLAKSVTVE